MFDVFLRQPQRLAALACDLRLPERPVLRRAGPGGGAGPEATTSRGGAGVPSVSGPCGSRSRWTQTSCRVTVGRMGSDSAAEQSPLQATLRTTGCAFQARLESP